MDLKDKKQTIQISDQYDNNSDFSAYVGDRLDFLSQIPDGAAQLVVTSPPYNIGKSYEKTITLEDYLEQQEKTIAESCRILSDQGSICWQVGNHITKDGEVVPLDNVLYPIMKKYGLIMRNKIIWHFEHGLHCTKRFSGRYETIIWFTKTNDYIFNLDPVRVPQKYPGKKHYKGNKKGEYSGNPKGKNPCDVWIVPNVKNNHVEKAQHPCQFPIELISRLVLSMTETNGLVVDPYMGVGSAACAAVMNKRRAAGADLVQDYVDRAKNRVQAAAEGNLKIRPMGKPVHTPSKNTSLTSNPWERESENNNS